jgi:hypothetical protein
LEGIDLLQTKDTTIKTSTVLYDAAGVQLHVPQEVFKATPRIIIRPYSVSRTQGIKSKRIAEIEYKGWPTVAQIPTAIRPTAKFALADKRTREILRPLTRRFPGLTKLVFVSTGKTSLGAPVSTFLVDDFEKMVRAVGKELKLCDDRRKARARNELAKFSTAIAPSVPELGRNGVSQLLEPYGSDLPLSDTDTDRLLDLISGQNFGKVAVTANFIRTKDKINVAYLEDVIAGYKDLMKATNDNEKAWQDFFGTHGWILGNVFPYEVILNAKEAYVGGKTIANAEGRVVDFLFQTGFRDNFALLEIKTHLTPLMRSRAYREPKAFGPHEKCGGALGQCLDQKHTFMTEFGGKLPTLDPKVVLLIGQKFKLTEAQTEAFELLRRNQKNIDIVTFDELLQKIEALRSILQM